MSVTTEAQEKYFTVNQGMCELKCSHRFYNTTLQDIVFVPKPFKCKGWRNWLCLSSEKYLAITPHRW